MTFLAAGACFGLGESRYWARSIFYFPLMFMTKIPGETPEAKVDLPVAGVENLDQQAGAKKKVEEVEKKLKEDLNKMGNI